MVGDRFIQILYRLVNSQYQMESRVPRPAELTKQFVRLVHEQQSYHTGYFQIIQFHQKRQKYYSTHISDGYFKCKVIFRDKPSKQIDKGEIKLFSVLYGSIANQGNRILMVTNELIAWDYPRTIGVIKSWRDQSSNVYINGNNYIVWNSNQTNTKISSTLKGDAAQSSDQTKSQVSFCASEINLRKNNRKEVPDRTSMSNHKVDKNQNQNKQKESRFKINQPFSFGAPQAQFSQSATFSTSVISVSNSNTNSNLRSFQFEQTQSIQQNRVISKPGEQSKNKSNSNINEHINNSKGNNKHNNEKGSDSKSMNGRKLQLIEGSQSQSQHNNQSNSKYKSVKKYDSKIQSITERLSEVEKDSTKQSTNQHKQSRNRKYQEQRRQQQHQKQQQYQSQQEEFHTIKSIKQVNGQHTANNADRVQNTDQKECNDQVNEAEDEDEDFLEIIGQVNKLNCHKIMNMLYESTQDILEQELGKIHAYCQDIVRLSTSRKDKDNNHKQEASQKQDTSQKQEERKYQNLNNNVPPISSNTKAKYKSIFQQLMGSDDDESVAKSQSHIKNSNARSSSQKQQNKSHHSPSSIKNTPIKSVQKSVKKQLDEADVQQIIYQSQQKTNSMYSIDNQLRIQDLSPTNALYGVEENSQAKNWITVIILCTKFMQDKNSTKMLVVAEQYLGKESGKIFNIVLANADIYSPFQDGGIYQLSLSNFVVAQPAMEHMSISVELRAVAQDVRAKKLSFSIKDSQPLLQEQPHLSYLDIKKIQSIREGVLVNIVGVVARYKNFALKKKGGGWTNIFTIADPFTGTFVQFTIFDPCKIIYEPGSPVVIYNAPVKLYQGKKTLGVVNYTFFYFGSQNVYERFCKFIPQLEHIKKWEEEGNSISVAMGKNPNCKQLSSLIQTEFVKTQGQQLDASSLNVQTPICTIIKVSPYYAKLICDKCNKKIMKNSLSCYDCGKRQAPLKQLQLSVLVADNTHSCFVQFNHYDSMNLIGEDGERINEFINDYIHKRVRLWLALNPKYKPIVTHMEVVDYEQLVKNQLAQLRNLLKFI